MDAVPQDAPPRSPSAARETIVLTHQYRQRATAQPRRGLPSMHPREPPGRFHVRRQAGAAMRPRCAGVPSSLSLSLIFSLAKTWPAFRGRRCFLATIGSPPDPTSPCDAASCRLPCFRCPCRCETPLLFKRKVHAQRWGTPRPPQCGNTEDGGGRGRPQEGRSASRRRQGVTPRRTGLEGRMVSLGPVPSCPGLTS